MRLSVSLWVLIAAVAWAASRWVGDTAGWPTRITAAIVLPLLVAWSIVMIGSLLAGALDRSGARATGAARLRLWWEEGIAFGWCFLLAQPFLAPFMRDHDRCREGSRARLLLVHGFVCNRGLWWRWRRRLRAAGYCTSVIDLAPSWWSMERQLERLGSVVEALRRQSPELPLYLVGHSMGGLAGRMLQAQAPDGLLSGVICLGAPHHGTVLAGSFGLREHGPPLPASGWLCRFNAAHANPSTVRLNVWSVDDAIVVPAASSQLDDADQRLLGYGHMGLCQSPKVLRVVSDWLDQQARLVRQSGAPAPCDP
jgi:pimeloyl-ACP methyl ester carboxylesterase